MSYLRTVSAEGGRWMVMGGEGGRTPHLALVLLLCVLHAQESSPGGGVMVDIEVRWDFEVELACFQQGKLAADMRRLFLPGFPTHPTAP